MREVIGLEGGKKRWGGHQFGEDRSCRYAENQRYVTGEDIEDCIDDWLSVRFQRN